MKALDTEIVAKAERAAPAVDRWTEAQWLPCTVSVELSIPRLKVKDLLKLERDSIIDTHCADGSTLPVWVNGAMIGWAEFDVVGKRLAIRVTELR